ncbi:hypothetical protein L2E82_50411 [Cichorium intybus]|nr:hypothetical protein L2E82_50411 [Cichorium intybus]
MFDAVDDNQLTDEEEDEVLFDSADDNQQNPDDGRQRRKVLRLKLQRLGDKVGIDFLGSDDVADRFGVVFFPGDASPALRLLSISLNPTSSSELSKPIAESEGIIRSLRLGHVKPIDRPCENEAHDPPIEQQAQPIDQPGDQPFEDLVEGDQHMIAKTQAAVEGVKHAAGANK